MNLKINHSSPLPLCAQVKEILRKMIALPEHINGRFLSKEVYLAKKLGISRNTLWQATNKLEYEVLIIRKKGYGTKVAKNSFTIQLDIWHSFTNYLIKTEWTECYQKIAAFFSIPEKVKTRLAAKIAVERLKIRQREPVLFRERFVSDSGNRPVESNICFYIGEKYTYSIEIRR